MINETSKKNSHSIVFQSLKVSTIKKCNKIKVFKQNKINIWHHSTHLPLIQFTGVVCFCTLYNVKCGCFHDNASIICSKFKTFI